MFSELEMALVLLCSASVIGIGQRSGAKGPGDEYNSLRVNFDQERQKALTCS